MSLEFPQALIGEDRYEVMSTSNSWGATENPKELEAGAQVYDRANHIWLAFHKAEMDAWLNPDGNQVDSTHEPQYQLQRAGGVIQRGSEEFLTIELITKIDHRNFYLGELSLVPFLPWGGTEKGFSLSHDELRGTDRMALSSQTEAFQFIDGVLKGIEKQAVMFGVLRGDGQEASHIINA